MNILIINTAFDYADYIVSTALNSYAFKTDSNAKHSETSLEYIDLALNKVGVTINEVDVIAVNLGPGSFTGIRIGVALAKGFASVNSNIKLIGFNSFEPFISRVGDSGNIYIETGKSDYYYASVKSGTLTEMKCKLEIDENENFTLFNNTQESSYTEDELVNLVKQKIGKNEFCTINELEPLYLKLSQAEQDLLSKTDK